MAIELYGIYEVPIWRQILLESYRYFGACQESSTWYVTTFSSWKTENLGFLFQF